MREKVHIGTGVRVGRLLVLEEVARKNNRRRFLCQCDCGARKEISRTALAQGATVSCGCFRNEVVSAINTQIHTRHGVSSHPLYGIFSGMHTRCNQPSDKRYKWYGGRGIRCYWDKPQDFIAYVDEHLGPRPSPNHSLDRINNDGDYCPGNLRWATRYQQLRNTRHNHLVTIGGETQPLAVWCYRLGRATSTVRARLRAGWSIEDALLVPPQEKYATNKGTHGRHSIAYRRSLAGVACD